MPCRVQSCGSPTLRGTECRSCSRHESGRCRWHRDERLGTLKPYALPAHVHVHVLWDDNVSGVDDPVLIFGFKPKSAQDNFLRTPPKQSGRARKVAVVVSTSKKPPSKMDDASVIAHCFGELLHTAKDGKRLQVWHVGATSSHTLNHSEGGTRWGTFPLTKYNHTKGKVRWTSRGEPVTRANFERLVHGTPNPYACCALAALIEACDVRYAYQNSSLPCAKLFNPEYTHATHPATSLLYRALGFRFVAEGYVWLGAPDEPFRRWQRLVDTKLARGKPWL